MLYRAFPLLSIDKCKKLEKSFKRCYILNMTNTEITQNLAVTVPFSGKDRLIAEQLLAGRSVADILKSDDELTVAKVVGVLSDESFKNYVASYVQDRVILADAIALDTLVKIMTDEHAKDGVKKDCAKIISDRSQKIAENQKLTDGTDPEDLSTEQLRSRLAALMDESAKRAKDVTKDSLGDS